MLQQRLQNCKFLLRKICKSVDLEAVVLGKVLLQETLVQLIQAHACIQALCGHNREIALKNQALSLIHISRLTALERRILWPSSEVNSV